MILAGPSVQLPGGCAGGRTDSCSARRAPLAGSPRCLGRTLCRRVAERHLAARLEPREVLGAESRGVRVVCSEPLPAAQLRECIPPGRLWPGVSAHRRGQTAPARLHEEARRLGIGLVAAGAVWLSSAGEAGGK